MALSLPSRGRDTQILHESIAQNRDTFDMDPDFDELSVMDSRGHASLDSPLTPNINNYNARHSAHADFDSKHASKGSTEVHDARMSELMPSQRASIEKVKPAAGAGNGRPQSAHPSKKTGSKSRDSTETLQELPGQLLKQDLDVVDRLLKSSFFQAEVQRAVSEAVNGDGFGGESDDSSVVGKLKDQFAGLENEVAGLHGVVSTFKKEMDACSKDVTEFAVSMDRLAREHLDLREQVMD